MRDPEKDAEFESLWKALKGLLEQWEAFEASSGNMEEAYYKLAKYARPQWEAARAAVAACDASPSDRPAEAGKPVVGVLVWRKPLTSNSLSRTNSIIGAYRVWTHHEANGQWFWQLEDGEEHVVGSEAEGKAAAQADYEARILSALSMPADIEPVAWLHPTANWSHVDYDRVRMHCGNDGPLPVPLYAAPVEEDKICP